MTVRAALPEDARLIKRLVAQLGYNNLSEEDIRKKITDYSSDHYALLVGVHEEQVIAFMSLHWFEIFHSKGRMGRISAFCVDEAHRSKGFGKQMMAAAENFLITKGCTKFEVTSNERRVDSHRFYLNLGYSIDSKRFIKYPPS